jgi:hypothetical protein
MDEAEGLEPFDNERFGRYGYGKPQQIGDPFLEATADAKAMNFEEDPSSSHYAKLNVNQN